MPAERRDHRPREHPDAVPGEVQQPRSHDARAIDHHADDFAAGGAETPVDGLGRRRRRVIDPDQTEVSRQALDQRLVEGRRRPVVHDDDLVCFGSDVALVRCGEGVERALGLAGDVVDDDHDGELGHHGTGHDATRFSNVIRAGNLSQAK
jgi:hypothetical protein